MNREIEEIITILHNHPLFRNILYTLLEVDLEDCERIKDLTLNFIDDSHNFKDNLLIANGDIDFMEKLRMELSKCSNLL